MGRPIEKAGVVGCEALRIFFGFDFCALLIIPVTLILEYSPGMLHHFATTTFVQFKLIFKKGHQ